MASFYGNIKNNSRSSFIFDRIYNSRSQMEDALNNNIDPETQQVIGDGVFINRYVLINYSYSVDGAYQQVPKESVNENNYTNYYVISQKDPSKKVPASLNENTNGIKPWSDAQNIDIFYQKSHYVDRFDLNFNENEYYRSNRELDAGKYFASYDHTVWQKIYSDNKEKYILVAELNAEAPTFELILDAPAAMNGAPHFDLSLSSELNYVYHVPKNWDIILNTYKPGETTTSDDKHYWYYESDLLDEDKTFDIKEEYPFINKKGFDKTTRVMKPVNEEGINLIETKSDMVYPQHQYRPIQLTIDTYVPNRYFVLDEEKIVPFFPNIPTNETEETSSVKFDINKYYFVAEKNDETYKLYKTCVLKIDPSNNYLPIEQTRADPDNEQYYVSDSNPFSLATGSFQENATIPTMYYELTTIPIGEGDRLLEHNKDTKRLDIYLPSIGNAVATMYDAIYGKPRYESRKIIGYTNDETMQPYEQDDFGGYEIDGSQYSLKPDEVNNLHIPVYNKDTGAFCGYITYETFINKYELNPDGYYMILGQPSALKPIYANEGDSFEDSDAANKYDIPVYELVDNIIGYTTAENIPLYDENEDGLYSIEDISYDLTDEDIGDLSPEMIPGSYDIPVYAKENMNARPYDDDKLFGTFAPPYDNITDEDNVSMGWALDALKKYISELRYLANGSNGERALGLQSDWVLDDDQAFGYIYHKPDIITSFTASSDQTFIAGKSYYEKKIDNNSLSPNYGYEYFEEINVSDINSDPQNPTSPNALGLYEMPKTLTKNAETDCYREENIAGYVDNIEIAIFTEVFKDNNNQYFQIVSTEMMNDSDTYYKRNGDSFEIAENPQEDLSIIYYTKIDDLNRIFIINDLYYYISNEQVNELQKYADGKKKIPVIRIETNFIADPDTYFIKSGSRYVPAYKLIGSYTLQPITQDQYIERCLCYFDKYQEITVDNNQIVKRKYRFNSYGDANSNIYLTTNSENNGFANKRISQFNIVIESSNMQSGEITEFPITDSLDIKIIENMTRRQLVDYLLDRNTVLQTENGNIDLPYATVEILQVFNEDFSCYINRNSNAFDFNQYVVSTRQIPLDEQYWSNTRNRGVIYYLRDYKPIEQIDYEINNIWNSVQVDD